MSDESAPTSVRNFLRLNLNPRQILSDEAMLKEITKGIRQGDVYVLQSGINIEYLYTLRRHLFAIMESNFAGYVPRNKQTENHFRCHWNDPRQEVPATFFSWSFFPWNEDPFALFQVVADLFILRNRLAGLPANEFFDHNASGMVPRLAAQFYPSGVGFMNSHQDPLSSHQLAIPTVSLSEYGKDFESGGVWMLDSNGQKAFMDPLVGFGEMTLFHPRIPHGIDLIDGEENYRPLSESGRLMFITAVNDLS